MIQYSATFTQRIFEHNILILEMAACMAWVKFLEGATGVIVERTIELHIAVGIYLNSVLNSFYFVDMFLKTGDVSNNR